MSLPISRSLLGSLCNSSVESDDVSPNITEVIVVRHGETEWNSQRRVQGQSDIDLNEVGREQALAVAKKLCGGPKFSVVYCSDLKRAFDTAQTIAKLCGGLEVVTDPELRERHMGDLQGVLWPEVEKVCPEGYQAFVSNQRCQEIPGGGESIDQFYERSITSLKKIVAKHRGKRIVMVGHGAYIEELYSRASLGKKSPKIPNASINVLHLSDDDEWTIEIWCDVSHLQG
ncbi:phosphatase [Lithospermum erythrorhizon]|uniref:Phosphatase n=1 Tax=Lithospermum erythrorhizon TaxID=34254 RepID=A0AAV3Q8J3_LITER